MKSNRYWLMGVICLLTAVVFFAAGFFTYSLINFINPQYQISFNREVSRENIINFNRVKTILMRTYYQDVDENRLLEGAIHGMAQAVDDPYTVYYTAEQMKDFMEKQSGNYVGIGVTVYMDENDLLTVSETFAGSPAKEAGMRIGDKIIKVDGEDVTSIKDSELIVQKIRGVPDTNVEVTVYRPEINDYITFNMVRQVINLVYIHSDMIEENIGYIQLKLFDEDISYDFALPVQTIVFW
jgi:carboxyl-terminal processing protease